MKGAGGILSTLFAIMCIIRVVGYLSYPQANSSKQDDHKAKQADHRATMDATLEQAAKRIEQFEKKIQAVKNKPPADKLEKTRQSFQRLAMACASTETERWLSDEQRVRIRELRERAEKLYARIEVWQKEKDCNQKIRTETAKWEQDNTIRFMAGVAVMIDHPIRSIPFPDNAIRTLFID